VSTIQPAAVQEERAWLGASMVKHVFTLVSWPVQP
jgi:hypothetical protein